MTELADLSALAAAPVCDLAPYQPGKPPDELEREYGISNAIKLASNENPRGPSPAVRAAMQKAAAEINRYPDGSGYYLHAALAEHLGVAPNQITLGNGSNDILVMLAEAFLTPEVAAVYDEYSFVIYRTAVQATGAQSQIAPSVAAGKSGHLGHDLDAMLALVDDSTRVVFIANPNNPTGTWVGTDALHLFLEQLPPDVIVVLDEAYFEYALADDYADTVPWLREFPNLVIVRTFSKAFGLAGLRVGYAVSSAPIAELLNRVRQPFNVNHIALTAAQAALQDQNWIAQTVKRNRRGMQLLQNGLQELEIEFVPSRANFLLAHFGADAAACNEYLLKNGVIVRPVANYGLADYLRISIGTEAELIVLLTQLADYGASQT
jgi:histidinol-phosphate aminotransferase